MKLCYSGPKTLATPKRIQFVDSLLGPVAYVFKTTHRFNNGNSLISFVKIDDKTYISANTFLKEFPGRYVLRVAEAPKEHIVFEGDVQFTRTLSNPKLKYCEVILQE